MPETNGFSRTYHASSGRMHPKIEPRTNLDTGKILQFLDMPREEPSFDFLRRLLIAYRDRVPYETATRLLRYRDIEKAEDRVRLPDEFWREKMTLGAGGSCSDSTYAFKKLLDALGFRSSLAINSEGEVARDAEGNVTDFPRCHSHCSVIASFGAERFVADPCCGTYIKFRSHWIIPSVWKSRTRRRGSFRTIMPSSLSGRWTGRWTGNVFTSFSTSAGARSVKCTSSATGISPTRSSRSI